MATLEGGILATLCVSQKVLFHNGLTIHLDQARIEIPDYWKAKAAYIYKDDQLIETVKAECEYEFRYELAHYNECIRSQFSFSPITPVTNTARYIGWCEKLYQSFEK